MKSRPPARARRDGPPRQRRPADNLSPSEAKLVSQLDELTDQPEDDATRAAKTVHQAKVVALVTATQAGNVEAFGELYDMFVDEVHKYIYCRTYNLALTQDLTSDTFERALKSIGGFRWKGYSLQGWLITIARNRVIDYIRSGKNKREVASGSPYGGDSYINAADDTADGDPAAQAINNINNRTLLEALKRLPEAQRDAIILTYLLGLNSREVGAIMGKTAEAVKALTLRGRRALLTILPVGFVQTYRTGE